MSCLEPWSKTSGQPALPQVPAAPPAAPIHQDIEPMILSAKSSIYNNLTILRGSMDPKEATELTETIFYKKSQILRELERLNGPVNGPILWQDGWDTIPSETPKAVRSISRIRWI